MSQKYTVMALFRSRSGKEALLREVLKGLLAPTNQEEGCLNYDLHESLEGVGKFLFYENWASKEAHQKHMGTPHIEALLKRVEELCAVAPEITFWEKLG